VSALAEQALDLLLVGRMHVAVAGEVRELTTERRSVDYLV